MTLNKVVFTLLALLAAFSIGRYSAPVSSKSETKTSDSTIVNNDKSKDTKEDEHKKTRTVTVTKPDGTKKSVTTITDDRSKDTSSTDKSKSSNTKTSDVTKEETKESSKLHISALAGSQISFSTLPKPDYGAMVSKDVLGPLNVGVFGFTNGFCGLSVGLSF